MRFLASTALLASLVGIVPAMAATNVVPSVKVSVPVVESQAQLAAQLQSQGFTKIQLSAFLPNMINPRPDITMPTKDLASTVVHKGWNGTAYKDGKAYQVYVAQ